MSKNDRKLTNYYINYLKTRQKYSKNIKFIVEDYSIQHLKDLYELNPNVPHRVFQFPRLPPGAVHPIFKKFDNPSKHRFSNDIESLNSRLQGFQRMYQDFAAGLFHLNHAGIIPPSHPLYSKKNSIETLKAENDKLQKENLELKKQIEQLKDKSPKIS